MSVLGAFLRRDAAVSMSYRIPFVLGFVQAGLSLCFLYFLSRLVGPRIATSATHGTYFDFAVLGTTMLTLFNTSLLSMAQRLRGDQTSGTLEVLFTMPVRPSVAVLGSAVYQVAYAGLASCLTLVVAVALGLRFHATALSALGAVAGLVSALVLFVAVGVAFAAYVVVFKRGETLTGLVVAGLTLLGGVYYPVSLMGHGLRVVANALPFTWVLAVLRSCLLDGRVPAGRLAQVAVSAAVALPLALWVFSAAVHHAKRLGSLGQY